MRIVLAVLVGLTAAAFASSGPAKADPYRWCADYGGHSGGSTNCYFLTIEQCRAAILGMGGFCRVNGFYDGRPVGASPAAIRTDGEPVVRVHRKKKHG